MVTLKTCFSGKHQPSVKLDDNNIILCSFMLCVVEKTEQYIMFFTAIVNSKQTVSEMFYFDEHNSLEKGM